jgi:GNAT superfamily N-acetyltransferase
MNPRYTITTALPHHLAALPAIELSAATLLRGHAPESILQEFTPDSDLRPAQEEGRLWVALADGVPVGFALVERGAAGMLHLAEMDVAPAHGRRGLGTALLRTVCAWARGSGFDQVTLTTFREVPWNMPFYARFGFEEIPAAELGPELAAVVQDETERGLDPAGRVVMRYRCG